MSTIWNGLVNNFSKNIKTDLSEEWTQIKSSLLRQYFLIAAGAARREERRIVTGDFRMLILGFIQFFQLLTIDRNHFDHSNAHANQKLFEHFTESITKTQLNPVRFCHTPQSISRQGVTGTFFNSRPVQSYSPLRRSRARLMSQQAIQAISAIQARIKKGAIAQRMGWREQALPSPRVPMGGRSIKQRPGTSATLLRLDGLLP